MSRFSIPLVLLCGLILFASPIAAETVPDSAGRTIATPTIVRTVFPAGPPAAIFLYMLAPDLMAGWPRPPRIDEMALIAREYAALPDIGLSLIHI